MGGERDDRTDRRGIENQIAEADKVVSGSRW
jgi:hypothetical protein